MKKLVKIISIICVQKATCKVILLVTILMKFCHWIPWIMVDIYLSVCLWMGKVTILIILRSLNVFDRINRWSIIGSATTNDEFVQDTFCWLANRSIPLGFRCVWLIHIRWIPAHIHPKIILQLVMSVQKESKMIVSL